MDTQTSSNLLDLLVKYWPLITATFAFIVIWVQSRNTDKDHEKRLMDIENILKELQQQNHERRVAILEKKNEADGPVLLGIQKDIVEIKTKLDIHLKLLRKE